MVRSVISFSSRTGYLPVPVIPRIFHQIWVGSAPFPTEFEAFQESWRARHPEWEFRFWTDENIPSDLRHREVYDARRSPAERSDIIRLELLWRHGGVYMDADFECRKPLDELLGGVDFFTALLKPGGRVNNAIIGSTPEHPILARALDELRVQELGTEFDKTASGPLFFASLLKDFPEATIFQADWFYPTTPEQRKTAYAVHHSARSWKDAAGWKQTALRAEERLERERLAHANTSQAMAKLERELATLRASTATAERRAERLGAAQGSPASKRRRIGLWRLGGGGVAPVGRAHARPELRGPGGQLKILFFLRGIQYGRMFENVLREALDRRHEVHIVLALEKRGWSDKTELFDALRERYEGFSWERLEPRDATWDIAAVALRHSLDYLRYLEPEFETAAPLRERARQRTPILVRGLLSFPFRGVLGRRAIGAALRSVEAAIPVPKSLLELIETRQPDVVLASPLIGLGSIETDHLRAAQACGLPTVLPVASWDNLSNKGVLRDVPTLTIVWNETQVDEAVRLHSVPPDRVIAVGAHSFDHWFTWKASVTREEFAERIGLDPERPVILYLGSSSFIAGDETAYATEWLARVRAHPRLRDAAVILRPHPYNAACWDEFADDPGRTVVWPRGGAVPDDRAKRSEYFDTLTYASAVVGVNTSALIEASILRRPVLTLVSEHFNTQTGTIHFSYLAHDGNSAGVVTVGYEWEEHLDQVADAIEAPDAYQARFDRFLSDFIRPAGLDVAAAPAAVDAVESAAAATVKARSTPLLTPLLTRLTPVVAALLPLFRPERTTRSAVKSTRKLIKRTRKRVKKLSRSLERRTKQLRSEIKTAGLRPTVEKTAREKAEKPKKPAKVAKVAASEQLPASVTAGQPASLKVVGAVASDERVAGTPGANGDDGRAASERRARQRALARRRARLDPVEASAFDATLEEEAALERRRQREQARMAAKASKPGKKAKAPKQAARGGKPRGGPKPAKARKRAREGKPTHAAKRGQRRHFERRARRLAGRARKQARRRWKYGKRSVYSVYNMRNRAKYASTIHVVPSRDEIPALLNSRKLNGKGAEIGVKRGGFSELLLRNWRCELLISIDPWLSVEWDAYRDRSNVTQPEFEENYVFTQGRLASFGPRSEIWRLTSVEAAEQVADGSLDFVYIDARHDYDSVLEDLGAWYSKLKPGGIFAGHDYADGMFAQGDFGVKSAVDEFFGERGIAVHGTGGPSPVELFPSWIVEIPGDGRNVGPTEQAQ